MSVGAAGAAAAAQAELIRQEEEELTPYSEKDLAEGWEFKILRASLAEFGKPEKFRAILEEEKKGGWVLVEKFDNCRIRLKRPAGSKVMEGDFADGYDPYRSWVGMSGEQLLKIGLSVAAVIFSIGLGLVLLIANGIIQ